MSDTAQLDTAEGKVFMHGRSQAVRIPKAFRVTGDRVRIRRLPGGKLLLEPVEFDIDAWFAKLDEYKDIPFMEEGRDQPPMPDDKDLSFD